MTTVSEFADFLISRLTVLADEQGEAQIIASQPGEAPAVEALRRVETIRAAAAAESSDPEKLRELHRIAAENGLSEDPDLPHAPVT